MLKLFGFLTKREDIETLAFVEYHENNHVPLICGLAPPPIVYNATTLCGATNATAKTTRSTSTS